MSKISPEDHIEAVLAGLKRGESDFGVKSRAILAFMTKLPGLKEKEQGGRGREGRREGVREGEREGGDERGREGEREGGR